MAFRQGLEMRGPHIGRKNDPQQCLGSVWKVSGKCWTCVWTLSGLCRPCVVWLQNAGFASIPTASTNSTLAAIGQHKGLRKYATPKSGHMTDSLNHLPDTQRQTHLRNRYGTESGEIADDLRRVIDAWGELPAQIKNAIISLVTGEGNRS